MIELNIPPSGIFVKVCYPPEHPLDQTISFFVPGWAGEANAFV
jgi:hypothetical protein